MHRFYHCSKAGYLRAVTTSLFLAITLTCTLLGSARYAQAQSEFTLSPLVLSEAERRRLIRELNQSVLTIEKLRDRVLIATGGGAKPMVRGYIAVGVGGPENSPFAAMLPEEMVYLPTVQVFLRNLNTEAKSSVGITDLSGRFNLNVPGMGPYEVCWEAEGFKPGCDGKYVINRNYRNVGTIEIPLPRDRNTTVVYGNVRLADGSSPRTLAPTLNANAYARVVLGDKGGSNWKSVPVNTHDQYLLTDVPIGESLSLTLKQEDYEHSQGLQIAEERFSSLRINQTILNSRPRLDPLVLLDDNGVRVALAKPEQRLKVLARVDDVDDDPLGYRWSVSAGTLSSTDESDPTWTLPKRPGNYAITLVVFDGRGGYSRQSKSVRIDRSGLEFSGIVSGTDSPVLSGAEVKVNGSVTLTNSRGYFRLKVRDRGRFVLSIKKRGYAMASRILNDSVTGGQWQLTRAHVATVDPAADISVQNQRKASDCPGPLSERQPWKKYPALARPQVQDGRGNIIGASRDILDLPGVPDARNGFEQPDDRPGCGPGARVDIPANSLVDARGNKPPGNIQVQISTVDLRSPEQMPGNYSVADEGGFAGVMQSYGAAIVELFDDTQNYNLAPGAKAALYIPVDQVQLNAPEALPAVIPLLSYDEIVGIWRLDGGLKLERLDGRPAYVGEVSHFTAYNSDLIKEDQACVAIQNRDMPSNYRLEWTVPQTGGAAPVVRSEPSVEGGNSETVLLNLPKNTNITIVPIRTQTSGGTPVDANQILPMGVFVVNTGEPQNPLWPTVAGGFQNEPQGPPYYTEDATGTPNGACSTKVVLSDLGLGFFSPPGTPGDGGAFLHGIGSFAAVNLNELDPAFPLDANAILRDAVEEASENYRQQIDPRGLRPTLACFKAVNRMPLDPGESCTAIDGTPFAGLSALSETTAVYANSIDLGFGREMHCAKNAADVACYVSNYDSLVYSGPGEIDDVSRAQAALDGLNNLIPPDATVAMEYTRIEDAGTAGSPLAYSDSERVVKFYVYNGLGLPVDKANLDGLGDRPVPQLCMVCHGGNIVEESTSSFTNAGVPTAVFTSRAEVKLGAKFLPFDLASFTYAKPDIGPCDPSSAQAFSKCDQQNEFKTLNELAAQAPPPDPADPIRSPIDELIERWYDDGTGIQNEEAVVAAWTTTALNRAVYKGTVARGCRTCHIANPDPTLTFARPDGGTGFADKLGATQVRVCKEHVMPHARRTHDLFWTSLAPNLPAQLQAYGDSVGSSGGWQDVNGATTDQQLVCGNEFTRGGDAPTGGAFAAVASIFSGNCSGCHYASNADNAFGGPDTYYGGLNLEPDVAYSQIVGVVSEEHPSQKRVEPGNPDASWLWHKINDTHTAQSGPFDTDGPGDLMPPFGSGLSSDNLDVINTWIAGGALP